MRSERKLLLYDVGDRISSKLHSVKSCAVKVRYDGEKNTSRLCTLVFVIAHVVIAIVSVPVHGQCPPGALYKQEKFTSWKNGY